MKAALRILQFHTGFSMLLIALLSGCGQDTEPDKQQTPDSVSTLPAMDSFRVTPNGLRYVHHEDKSGPHPQKGDIVRMDMLLRTADRHLMNTFVGEKNYFMTVKEPAFKGDIVEILPQLSEGDSVTAKTLATYLYQGRVPPQIGQYDTVYTHIKILGFFNEREALLNHITRQGHRVDTLQTGLYRTFFQRGQGKAIAKGDSVVMQYTGSLLNGTVFNTSRNKAKPLAFTYGKKDLLKGLSMGLKGLKPGAHVKLFMTSDYGYGKGGARPIIVPFSPLIYDIKVMKVMSKPA